VNLPQASVSAADIEMDKNVIIEMNREGLVFINGQEMPLEELPAIFGLLAKDTSFIIRADGEISRQRFVDVADLLKQMQFTKVAVQTRSR
jgi:biopolymer transport protein ExbD